MWFRCAAVHRYEWIIFSLVSHQTIITLKLHWCTLGQPILEHIGTGWLELAENWFIRFSARHRGKLHFSHIYRCVPTANLISITFTGSSHRKYLTEMWWFLEILVAARMPISWRSVIEVKFNSSLYMFSCLFMERPSRDFQNTCSTLPQHWTIRFVRLQEDNWPSDACNQQTLREANVDKSRVMRQH